MRIAREGIPFAAGCAILAGAGTLALGPWGAAAPGAALLFVLFFFRDPERVSPDEPGAILSPADGRVIVATENRVSIFLSLGNVHVCRTPVAGRVEEITPIPGRFLAAFRDAASEQNERTSILVSGDGVRVRFALVAGLVARRIVCRVRPGQILLPGERVAVIRFGSRVDLDVPEGAITTVRVGERVFAGVSVLARLGNEPRAT